MTTLHKGSTVPPLKQALPILAALVAAGLVGNSFPYELFFNIQFIFGSVFAMLALQVLGLRLGTLAALLISSSTYPLWNHPYAIVISTGEVMAVGLLVQRREVRIVVADTLYWLMIGMPLVYRIYEVDAGYDPNDIQQAVSFYAGQDQEVMARSFKRAVEAGEAYDLELRFNSGSGTRKWVRTTGQTEVVAGKTVRVFGHIMDITERKQAEIEREQYFKFFTTSSDLKCIADPNGCVKKVNPACWQTLGYSEAELMAKPFMGFVHPDDRQSTLDERARQLQRSYSLDFENRSLCKDGSVRWLSWRASYNKDDGLTYATARDITERKQVEERIRQSLREKETLLKEVHHRVKNNLAVVSSLLNLQAKQIKDESLKGMFEESQQRIKSIALVHEKLYRSKDLSRIDFSDYITTIIGELRSSYRKEGGEIGVNIRADTICLDIDAAVPCGLIINELVTNSLKYAFPGSKSGEVGISVTESDSLYTLTVKDNGRGLPEGFDHTRTGTLGLQLVEALTRQLRGTLEIRSVAGMEAVVTFSRKDGKLAAAPSASGEGFGL